MDIAGEGLEVVVRVLGHQVTSAQDVLNLARHQQLLEARRDHVGTVRDVQVANDKNELRSGR